eukprot:873106-Alexandrium_andersonii.AAC.1
MCYRPFVATRLASDGGEVGDKVRTPTRRCQAPKSAQKRSTAITSPNLRHIMTSREGLNTYHMR